MKPCWSCGTTEKDCYSGCECLKCVDVDAYNAWKYDYLSDSGYSPSYERWIEEQQEEDENWD